jgi:hypothetical protein
MCAAVLLRFAGNCTGTAGRNGEGGEEPKTSVIMAFGGEWH